MKTLGLKQDSVPQGRDKSLLLVCQSLFIYQEKKTGIEQATTRSIPKINMELTIYDC